MQALPKEIRVRLSALSGPQGEEACEELRGLIHEGGAGGVAAELARNQKGMEALARALTGESEAMRLCAASCFRWVVFFFLCLFLVHLEGVIQARLAAGGVCKWPFLISCSFSFLWIERHDTLLFLGRDAGLMTELMIPCCSWGEMQS